MSGAPKLLFDENFGQPSVKALATLAKGSADKPRITHYLELFPEGEDDDVWIPQVANEGYAIISADRGSRMGGSKFPLVCKAHNVTHVLVSARIHERSSFEKMRAVIHVWPGLMGLVDAPAGSRYLLRLSTARTPMLVRNEAAARPPA